MTHDSFAVSEEVVKSFENEYGVKLVFLKSGDTGAALNRAILTKNDPEADVFYGVDNTFLSRAVQEEIFEPYSPALLDEIPEEFTRGLAGVVTPIDFGDVCINYDVAWFATNGLPVPASLEDLTNPIYGGKAGEGMLVVENPATSSPGLAFLLATIAEFGEEGYLDYVEGAQRQRRGCGQRLGNRILHELFRLLRKGVAANGRVLRLQSCRRGDLCQRALTKPPRLP